MNYRFKVIKPIFNLEIGDILEPSEDGKFFTCSMTDEFSNSDESGNEKSVDYMESIKLSTSYAMDLFNNGYFEKLEDDKNEFKNVFIEIDSLIEKYTTNLNNIEEEYKDQPACLKIEAQTVYKNLIKTLNYLRGLKK